MTLLQGAAAWVDAVTFDALLGVDSIEVNGVEPRPSEASEGPCLDLALHSSGPIYPGCTALGIAVPTLEFSGAMDPKVAGLGLSDSPGSSCLPIDWGQVENDME
jgi:hypothetical protein